MTKPTKTKLLISSVIILLPILFGLAVWEQLPEKVATHWGPNGQPDGWSSKAVAVFFMPAFLLAMHFFTVFVTGKDPKNQNQSAKIMHLRFWLIPILSLFVGAMTYATALDSAISPILILPLFMGITFILLGNYMPKCQQNQTIGIKVKWTLENEENWNATHRFGGKVFVICGILLLGGVFLPLEAIIWVTLPLILTIGAVPILYSYLYHKKHS